MKTFQELNEKGHTIIIITHEMEIAQFARRIISVRDGLIEKLTKKTMITDLFRETIRSLSTNKARSSLTILGIVIGIASVITMVAIGQGAQSTIESNIESIGSNLIVVMPGAQRVGGISQGAGSSQTLILEDSDAIKSQVQNVKAVAPEASRRYQITARGTNTNTRGGRNGAGLSHGPEHENEYRLFFHRSAGKKFGQSGNSRPNGAG